MPLKNWCSNLSFVLGKVCTPGAKPSLTQSNASLVLKDSSAKSTQLKKPRRWFNRHHLRQQPAMWITLQHPTITLATRLWAWMNAARAPLMRGRGCKKKIIRVLLIFHAKMQTAMMVLIFLSGKPGSLFWKPNFINAFLMLLTRIRTQTLTQKKWLCL